MVRRVLVGKESAAFVAFISYARNRTCGCALGGSVDRQRHLLALPLRHRRVDLVRRRHASQPLLRAHTRYAARREVMRTDGVRGQAWAAVSLPVESPSDFTSINDLN